MKIKYKISIPIIFISIVGVFIFAGCQGQTISPPASAAPTSANFLLHGKEIAVFAGSASKPPLDEAAKAFEKQTGIKVYLTYGGSGAVLSQMELSKTGDIYIPGSPDYMIKSESKRITDPSTAQIIAYLVPAIAIQRGNPRNIRTLADLAKPGIRAGIGNPNSVCLGLYSIEIFEYNRILPEVIKNVLGNGTFADSCDKTATLISLKAVDAVIGWSVFDDWDPENIDIVYLRAEEIPRLAYIPAAISTFSKDKTIAGEFISFLVSRSGQDIFKKWGYNVTEAEARKFAPNATIGGEYKLPDSYKSLVK